MRPALAARQGMRDEGDEADGTRGLVHTRASAVRPGPLLTPADDERDKENSSTWTIDFSSAFVRCSKRANPWAWEKAQRRHAAAVGAGRIRGQ